MKTMSIRLDEDLHAQLQTYANDLGIGTSVLARAIIKSAVEGGFDLMISPSLQDEDQVSITRSPAPRRRKKKRRK